MNHADFCVIPSSRCNFIEDIPLRFVNQHSTVAHYPRPTVTHFPEGGQVGRSRSRASLRDDPSRSFLCRSSLVTFPSLPDEKELL